MKTVESLKTIFSGDQFLEGINHAAGFAVFYGSIYALYKISEKSYKKGKEHAKRIKKEEEDKFNNNDQQQSS